MTDHTQPAGLDAVREVQRGAAIAHANAVYDALDKHWEDLDRAERYDIAAETWRVTADTDARLTDDDIVRLINRAADHLPSALVVDLIDIHFGEHEKKITTADDFRLTWLPDDGTLIIGAPIGGGVVDARMFTGKKHTHA